MVEGPLPALRRLGAGQPGAARPQLRDEEWQRERQRAFRLFDEARLLKAYRLATLVLRDRDEAEDATQEAIGRAWDAWASLRDDTRFEPWFDRILVNVCRNQLRRRRIVPMVSLDGALDVSVPDRSGQIVDRIALERAFANLTPDQRIVVALRFERDLTVEQIAETVGIPAGTVKSRLHYAVKALRDALVRGDRSGRRGDE